MTKAAIALLLLGGCASYVHLPPEHQARIERELNDSNREWYLKLSYYVTPFFGDASKRLLTPVPPEEVRLLNHPNGEPVNPGPIQKVLAAGTRARIRKVELPTAWVVTERVPYTPRTQPWVYLTVEGDGGPTPLIIVLRPQIKTDDELRAELERYLSPVDPSPRMAEWSEAFREAVRAKKALLDMPADALEMAWGYPELKRITFEEQVKKEEWRYAGGKRVAHLADGRVVKLEPN